MTALWRLALAPLLLARRMPWRTIGRWAWWVLAALLAVGGLGLEFLGDLADGDLPRWLTFFANVALGVFLILTWRRMAGGHRWAKIAHDWQENSYGWKRMYRAHLRECHGRDLDPGEGP